MPVSLSCSVKYRALYELCYVDHCIATRESHVLQQYYSKVVDYLPTKELSHYFVSQGILTLMDNEDITSSTTSSAKASEMLLSNISLSLQKGDAVPLKKLLNVMQRYGNDTIVNLSCEIQRLLLKGESKS